MDFAATPEPPYYAAIFTSRQRDDTGYDETAERMFELASRQPGYLGVEHASGPVSITVSYWRDEASIAAWRRDVEHAEAQARGRNEWYEAYELRVARVERTSSFVRPAP